MSSLYSSLAREVLGDEADRNSDWDLWGPLVICLSLAILLSVEVSS